MPYGDIIWHPGCLAELKKHPHRVMYPVMSRAEFVAKLAREYAPHDPAVFDPEVGVTTSQGEW